MKRIACFLLFTSILSAACIELACCTAPPLGRTVVNADQTVLIIWDPVAKMEHFIRRASFKSESPDFGFLIPTPSKPDLDESGDNAFPFLEKLTEPEVITQRRWVVGSGCMATLGSRSAKWAATTPVNSAVRVLEEKLVAGFNAAVLEADSASALAAWLREKKYNLSPEIEAWAKPYVDAKWKITALKLADESSGASAYKRVEAQALRMSFATDRPLFPYREGEYKKSDLTNNPRMLRIYFVSDERYGAELGQKPWNSKVAWSGVLLPEDRKTALERLKLPESSGPGRWRLTEFEHNWPYTLATADVYFARAADQSDVRRPPIYHYVDAFIPIELIAFGLIVVVGSFLIWRWRRNAHVR